MEDVCSISCFKQWHHLKLLKNFRLKKLQYKALQKHICESSGFQADTLVAGIDIMQDDSEKKEAQISPRYEREWQM